MRDWDDLRRAAMTDPFLHRCAHLERHVGRETALIETALALAEERQRLHDRIVRILSEAPSRQAYDAIREIVTA